MLDFIVGPQPSEIDYRLKIAEVEADGRIVLCRECHQVLTGEEIVFYENRCEVCETEWTMALCDWRHGLPVDQNRAAEFEAMAGFGKLQDTLLQ